MPTGQRGDLSVVLLSGEQPVAAAVFEPQRTVDPAKWYSWPRYLSDLHAEVRCPTYLIVLALGPAVADWARRPISSFQPGWHLRPYVLGPEDVPRVTSLAQALEDPMLAALGAVVHADEETAEEQGYLAIRAVRDLRGEDHAWWLYRLLYAIMTPERSTKLQELTMLSREALLPKTPYDWAKYNEGKASAIVSFLTLRQVSLTEEQRQRILAERETGVLDRWLARAVTATSADELFV